jgi:hypothetical protein
MIKPIYHFIALILFFWGVNIRATTYYIDSDSGSDMNSGKSFSAAWNSISKVNSFRFNSGDTISFKCGQRYLGTTITGKSNIIFNSYGTGARPVIDGLGVCVCVDFDSKTNIIFKGLKFVNGTIANINLWNCSNVTFESCNIDSAWYVPGHADYDDGSVTMNFYSGVGSNLTVRNCTMSYAGGSHGIYIDGTDNTLLEFDTLMYNAHDGIRIGFGNDNDWTDNLTIRYCVSKFNKYAQLEEDGARNSNIYYNVFEMDPGYYTGDNTLLQIHQDLGYDCPQSNVYYYNNTFIGHNYGSHDVYSVELKSTSGMQNIVFKNNIFYYDSNVKYGIYLENWYQDGVYGGLGSFVFTNNLYYTAGSKSNLFHSDFTSQNYSTISAWQSATGYETNSLYANPLFTNYNTGDYLIQGNSPAIGSGSFVGLNYDINGTQVPVYSPDMGAYQHINTQNIFVDIKILIEGIYNNESMSTYFNVNNMIPLSQPYNTSPWNYTGSESVSKIPANIVDWILVELRSTSNYSLVASRAGFLKNTGTIVDLDGISSLRFNNISSGNYYIVIKYINTIETWSKNGGLPFTDATVSYDFTTAESQAFGNNLILVGTKWCIYSGDINKDGDVDADDIASINSDNDDFTYHVANDLNGDGIVDLSDLIIADFNKNNHVRKILPPGAL